MSAHSRSTVIAIAPIAPHAVPFTENSFTDWIVDSFPGDKIVYYRGLLAHDRAASGKILDRRPRAELNAVATRVHTMASHGLVHPVQKRVGPNDFLYIAIKTQPRASAAAPISTAPGKSRSSEHAFSRLAA